MRSEQVITIMLIGSILGSLISHILFGIEIWQAIATGFVANCILFLIINPTIQFGGKNNESSKRN